MSIKITALYERLSRDNEMQSESNFTPFLNIMNEWYAKDTSKKIRTMFSYETVTIRAGNNCQLQCWRTDRHPLHKG